MVEKSQLSFKLVLEEVIAIKFCCKLEFFMLFHTPTSLEYQIFQPFVCLIALLVELVTNSLKDVVHQFSNKSFILFFGSVGELWFSFSYFKLAKSMTLSLTYWFSNSVSLLFLADGLEKALKCYSIRTDFITITVRDAKCWP